MAAFKCWWVCCLFLRQRPGEERHTGQLTPDTCWTFAEYLWLFINLSAAADIHHPLLLGVCVCVSAHTHIHLPWGYSPLGWHTAVAPGRLHNIEWRMRPLTISVLLFFFKIEYTLNITTYRLLFFCFVFLNGEKILFLRMAVKTVWSLHYFHFTKKESQQVL